ncbi:hypothetical protein KVR01_006698 [Diaporthe batatas]|uniref:uncharacterized protein n=1 Tax=Diaporthe batatas TaxID=748121 RepID=UPI001D043F65|nr:uncharacterized protein KVR01_006698 [Diaporthe batatas]KAG8163401.1 hypothetical protein KVR01_006698 [Diaporthe batatas]
MSKTSLANGNGVSDKLILQALSEVNATAQQWSNASSQEKNGDDTEAAVAKARFQLANQVWRLYSAIKGPADMVHDHLERFTYTGAVRTLLAVGVFDELPTDGKSKSAQQLSDKLGIEKLLLIRLMRITTALGLFAEVNKEEYAHTALSKAYLAPGLRGFFQMAVDEHMAVSANFHEYFQQNGYKVPTSPNDNPYTFHFKTGGLPIFEWMQKFPARIESFNMAMTTGSKQGDASIALFPWREAVKRSSSNSTTAETPLVIDVGGGRGHAAHLIRQELDGVPGRVIVQDLPGTIEQARDEYPDVEKLTHNFFEPQPVKGALVYFIRRVLHDWPDEVCVGILKNVALAMTPESRIVINEFLVPEVGADAETCWVDLVMLTFAGMERTAAQFEAILNAAGLKLTKIHSSPKTHYVAVEAQLK